MVEFCERCKRDTDHAVVKNKRGSVKREADQADKKLLRKGR